LTQSPKSVTLEKSFLFGGNPIVAEFSVANGGVIFVGQKLFLHVTVNNQSSRSVSGLYLRLDQFVNMKAHNEKKLEQSIERKHVLINALIENSGVNSGASFDQDLILEIPQFIPGSIRKGLFLTRQYNLNLDVELSISGSMTLTLPLILLEWSPQLKGKVPDVVPISIREKKEVKQEEIIQEEKKR